MSYVSPPGKVISFKNIWRTPYKESKDSAAIVAFREATCTNVVKSSYIEFDPLDFDQSVTPPAADSLRWYGRT